MIGGIVLPIECGDQDGRIISGIVLPIECGDRVGV
jgi:hypothetical protein